MGNLSELLSCVFCKRGTVFLEAGSLFANPPLAFPWVLVSMFYSLEKIVRCIGKEEKTSLSRKGVRYVEDINSISCR